jgi:enoyl-CoA hydratase
VSEQLVLVERDEQIAVCLLNRPQQLNALSDELMTTLVDVLDELDRDDGVRCIVLGGSDRAFAAGADIGQLAQTSAMEMYAQRRVDHWDQIRALRTPLVAAVSGFCLGGGCELAMACDLIVASETAKFGQPETGLGIIPGAGGTQRLTRVVGKAKTMEMVLTGRMMDAEEAERANLVARVVPVADLLDEALKLAETIAEKSQPIVAMAKEAVNVAYETTLNEGLRFERRTFYATFAAEDRREGMQAFLEKRTPNFNHR